MACTPDLISANIKKDAVIFGVPGNANVVDTGSANAVAGDIISGKVAWVDGAPVTGSMVKNGTGTTLTTGTSDQKMAAGYWSALNTVSGDADLMQETSNPG